MAVGTAGRGGATMIDESRDGEAQASNRELMWFLLAALVAGLFIGFTVFIGGGVGD